MKKKIIAGILGLTAVSAGVAAYGGGLMQNTGLQDAVSAGDYGSFVEQLSAIDPLAAEHMTQERFEFMQGRDEMRQEVQDAIEAGDYDAFVDAAAHQMTQDEFEDMVARHTAHDAIEAAIDAGDYDAWVEAVQALPFGDDIASIVDADEFSAYIELREEGGLGMNGGAGMGTRMAKAGCDGSGTNSRLVGRGMNRT